MPDIIPAIVAVGYDRPESMHRLLASIGAACFPDVNVDLIISIDRAKNYLDVKQEADNFNWPYGKKIVRTFDERQGLRKHILQCGDLSIKYGAVIILEDDLVVSESFYLYAYRALNFYDDDERVCGIALYSHEWNGYGMLKFSPERNQFDTYLGQYSITWGQCWTKKQWERFKSWYVVNENKLHATNTKMPEQISGWGERSWGKYFVTYIVENDLYYVIPYDSMTTNFSEVGEHFKKQNSDHQVRLLRGVKQNYSFPEFLSAIKYDVFFERILDSSSIFGGIPGDNICFNLNQTKQNTFEKEYLISDKILELECIKSFGMCMRPVDANIVNNVDGKDIFLYKCGPNYQLSIRNHFLSSARGDFEFYHYNWRVEMKMAFRGMYKFVLRLFRRY